MKLSAEVFVSIFTGKEDIMFGRSLGNQDNVYRDEKQGFWFKEVVEIIHEFESSGRNLGETAYIIEGKSHFAENSTISTTRMVEMDSIEWQLRAGKCAAVRKKIFGGALTMTQLTVNPTI